MKTDTGVPRLRATGRAFEHIARFHPELTAFRRDLHAHPELGFEEVAARINFHENIQHGKGNRHISFMVLQISSGRIQGANNAG